MLMEKYEQLPDGMLPVDVLGHFLELLNAAESGQYDEDDALSAICEVSDRQWHTYTTLPVDIRRRIGQWIQSHWRSDSVDFVEKVAFVTGCLGLSDVMAMLKESLKNESLSHEVQSAIGSAIRDLGTSSDDPFFTMHK